MTEQRPPFPLVDWPGIPSRNADHVEEIKRLRLELNRTYDERNEYYAENERLKGDIKDIRAERGEALDNYRRLLECAAANYGEIAEERDALHAEVETALNSAGQPALEQTIAERINNLHSDYLRRHNAACREKERAEAAERKLAMAREALEFYSIRTTYVSRTGNDSPISRDGFGGRARAALAALEAKDGEN